MKVQKVILPDSGRPTWILLGDDFMPIQPVDEFLSYLRNLERSPNTVRAYAYHLRLYWEYLEQSHLDWKNIGLTELADFVHWLRNPQGTVASIQEVEAKRTEATVNAIITSVGMLYDFHERNGEVKDIPLYTMSVTPGRRYKSFLHHINKGKPTRAKLIRLKEPRRYPKTLPAEDVQRLVDACHRIRDKFLVQLLYESGMRIGQALGLRLEDIESRGDNYIRIVARDDNPNGARAKTKDTYKIDVSQALMGLYTDYMLQEFLEVLGDSPSEYVFVNLWDGQIGAPMTYSNVMDLFLRIKRKTGIAINPHMLRHTHATELIRAGDWDVAHVQKRLGHAHVQTTLNTYIHLSDQDMKEAYQEFVEKRYGSCSLPDSEPRAEENPG